MNSDQINALVSKVRAHVQRQTVYVFPVSRAQAKVLGSITLQAAQLAEVAIRETAAELAHTEAMEIMGRRADEESTKARLIDMNRRLRQESRALQELADARLDVLVWHMLGLAKGVEAARERADNASASLTGLRGSRDA